MKKTLIKEVKTLAETKFLSLYEAKYENKRGKEKSWTIASRKNLDVIEQQLVHNKEDKVDAVVIAALHEKSKSLVIIKQFRVPINDYIYELPAGLIDPNEDIKSTLSRELREETGLIVTEVLKDKCGDKLYLSPGMTDESVALIYCLCEGEISKEFLEEDEEIEAILVSKEKAKEILKSNSKFDVKTFMLLNTFVTMGEELFKR